MDDAPDPWEALQEAARNPISPSRIFRYPGGEPMWTREEWERFGRWRRLRDRILGWDPPDTPTMAELWGLEEPREKSSKRRSRKR